MNDTATGLSGKQDDEEHAMMCQLVLDRLERGPRERPLPLDGDLYKRVVEAREHELTQRVKELESSLQLAHVPYEEVGKYEGVVL